MDGNQMMMHEITESVARDLRKVVDEMRMDDLGVSPRILIDGWANVLECLCAALETANAMPLRNCDLHADDTTAREAYGAWYQRASTDERMSYGAWLFAPATERKGEGDEQK